MKRLIQSSLAFTAFALSLSVSTNALAGKKRRAASAENKRAATEFCDKYKSDNPGASCIVDKRTCPKGYVAERKWKGKGTNYSACVKGKKSERKGKRKAEKAALSDEKKAQAEQYCAESTDACKVVSGKALNACGKGWRRAQSFKGRGKNWIACKRKGVEGKEANKRDAERYCQARIDQNIACKVRRANILGCGKGWRKLKKFNGAKKNYIACGWVESARKTRRMSVTVHEDLTLSAARVDAILADATTVLQTDDGEGDFACPVTLRRSGSIGTFSTGDGSIDTKKELRKIFKVKGHVKVIDTVDYCDGYNTSTIGCGKTPGESFIVERFTANQEGILWAHEYGHNMGLKHRESEIGAEDDTVMFPSIGTDRLKIDHYECARFAGFKTSLAGETQVRPSTSGSSKKLPVKKFVRQHPITGLPLDKAAEYTEKDVPVLIKMLQNPKQAEYHENIALTLGMIGSKKAVKPLIRYLKRSKGNGRNARKGRVGAMVGLGYLVNKTKSKEALDFLIESSAPSSSKKMKVAGLGAFKSGAPLRGRLNKYAIMGLGMSGNPKALKHLKGLRVKKTREPGSADYLKRIDNVIESAIEENANVKKEGLKKYYRSRRHKRHALAKPKKK